RAEAGVRSAGEAGRYGRGCRCADGVRRGPVREGRPRGLMAFTALDQAVQFLKSVGPRRAEALARLGVHTARDLLFHAPRRYEDASTVTRIGNVRIGDDVTVIGEVAAKGVLPTRS